MDKLTFFKGEKREVTAVIYSVDPKEPVVIAASKYELKKTNDNSVVQEGSCEIKDNIVVVLLDFAEKGNYELTIESSVGREVIIDKILVIIE